MKQTIPLTTCGINKNKNSIMENIRKDFPIKKCLHTVYVSRFTRGSRNEETRIVTNEVFNEGQTEVTQEHGEEHPNSFDT